MFLFSRHNRIIKKGVAKTLKEFDDRMPKICQHFFYGAVDIAPQNLVIWYLFETDAELSVSKESGFCDELTNATVRNLISLGYPSEAFNVSIQDGISDKITFEGGTEEARQALISALTNRKAMVSFTTIEDIDRKANGDYHIYFQ